MKYKIIAVDMDGTLLNDDKHISDYNLSMIDKAVNLGVKFVIASGRLPAALRFYQENVSKSQPMICSNGSIVLDGHKNVIYSNSIPNKCVVEIIDTLREQYNGIYFHFYHGDILCGEQFRYLVESFYKFCTKLDRKYRMEIRLLKDAKEYIVNGNYPVNKLVVMDDNIQLLDEIRVKINKIPGIEVTKSEINNLEILAEGTSKGSALNKLSQYYDIPLSQCIAVGNDENDISMIKTAGLGVAMKNARECAKEYSGYITKNDNNHGGIGEVIDKFILNSH